MSSSAQLALLPWLWGWPEQQDRTTFAAGLHAGSSVGIALALRTDLHALTPGTRNRLLMTAVPAAVAGLLAQETVEARLGRPGPTAALLAGAGALMWLADRRLELRPVGNREAAIAAVAQVAALAPGVSRSGAALTALRLLGVRRDEAMRFVLLMSLPITFGAAALTSLRARTCPAAVPSALAALSAYGTTRAASRASVRVVTVAAVYRLGMAAAVGRRLRAKGKP